MEIFVEIFVKISQKILSMKFPYAAESKSLNDFRLGWLQTLKRLTSVKGTLKTDLEH